MDVANRILHSLREIAESQEAYILVAVSILLVVPLWLWRRYRKRRRKTYGRRLRDNMKKMREDAPYKK